MEFALVAPALLALVWLLIECGMQLATQAALDYGARQASRFGMTGAAVPPSLAAESPPPTRAQAIVQLVVQAGGGLINASRLNVTVQSYAGFGSVGQSGSATAGPGGSGSVVQYQLSYLQPYFTSYAAAVIGAAFQLHTASVLVQNEPYPQ